MTAGLYCRARIDRSTIRRDDEDNADTPIASGFLGLCGFRRLGNRGVAEFERKTRVQLRPSAVSAEEDSSPKAKRVSVKTERLKLAFAQNERERMVVRKRGFEPPQGCPSQSLKLVRLMRAPSVFRGLDETNQPDRLVRFHILPHKMMAQMS